MQWLFETSWEVCNKVGGIYAVLSTKAHALKQLYGDRLIFIGPDLWTEGNESPDFDTSARPLTQWKADNLPCDLRVRVGRWKVPGQPIAVLVSFRHLQGNIDEIYARMWEQYGVDSLHAYGDYDEACAFAVAASMVIESITQTLTHPDDRVVAHFDEWTTGMGLLRLKSRMPQVRTVFTTHATSIGRSIAGNGKPLYDYLPGYHGDQMAQELNMQSKHSLEKAAAQAATVFTTVSQVTARECEQLLQRRPVVTPNAFEQRFVPKGRALQLARQKARNRILQVVRSLTGRQLAQDSFMIATSGRCEFRNKGIDLYLDALNVMRTKLDEATSDRPVVAMVLVPSWVDGPRPDLAARLDGKAPNDGPLEQCVITHRLHQPEADVVLSKMRHIDFNRHPANDRLLVVDVPCYLDGNDGIIGLTYYDILVGLDLTVFPSYYEPWGYTPLESVAFSVPTITTNLAGFGQWVTDEYATSPVADAVTVVHRDDANYHQAVHEIARLMMEHWAMQRDQCRQLRTSARIIAKAAQWQRFIQYYVDAYQQAFSDKNSL